MEYTEVKQRLNGFISNEPSPLLRQAEWIKENEDWLEKSALIALKILKRLRETSMSQKQLAEEVGVSPQYINKVVKGKENLSLQTICMIEKALGINLMEVPGFEKFQEVKEYAYGEGVRVDSIKARQLASSYFDYTSAWDYTDKDDNRAA